MGYSGRPLFSSLPSMSSFQLVLCILGSCGAGDDCWFGGLPRLGKKSILSVLGFCAVSFSVLEFGSVDVRPVKVVGSASRGCIWHFSVV